jgi:hydroxymethylglutaryl-CoA lyase
MRAAEVRVRDVGPRDGLQSIARTMPTAAKVRWIRALRDAGMAEIEVGSFVPPKLLPQMADCEDVVREALTMDGLAVVVLAPNLKGALRAFASGAHKVTVPISVSRAHSLANVRKTPDEALAELGAIHRARDELPGNRRPLIEAALATAFGCTIQGAVPEDDVLRAAATAIECADTLTLADTTGYANPAQVRRLFQRVGAEVGDRLQGAHFHNTRGLGLANVVAALETGIRHFDSSQAGIGGCPFAPGATGNVVTEDLVFMLESMGIATGIDVERLIAARAILAEALPGEPLYGYVPQAGLTKGYAPA